MIERAPEQVPTPAQTLKTFHIAAKMFLSGKDLAFKHIHNYPFIPSLNELAERLVSSTPELGELTEWQRSFLLVNGLMKTWNLMNRRAICQAKMGRNPIEVKKNLLSAIKFTSEGELDLDPRKVEFEWSLFSVGLVADGTEFDKILEYSFGKKHTRKTRPRGFIGLFATELGRMPVVQRRKEYQTTVWHEDIHVWQQAMGYDYKDYGVSNFIDKPEILRTVENEAIQPGDLEENEKMLKGILHTARGEMRIELPAYLWCKEFPLVNLLQSPDSQDINFALVNIINAIYFPANTFREDEQIARHYKTLMKISAVDLERRQILAIAQQAIRSWGTQVTHTHKLQPFLLYYHQISV